MVSRLVMDAVDSVCAGDFAAADTCSAREIGGVGIGAWEDSASPNSTVRGDGGVIVVVSSGASGSYPGGIRGASTTGGTGEPEPLREVGSGRPMVNRSPGLWPLAPFASQRTFLKVQES